MTAPYSSRRFAYEGTETTETSIVRTGGSVDPSGQAQSRKIVTTANCQWLRPFRCEPWAIWNETTGANVTVTVYGNGASVPLTDEVWIECEYLGDASSSLGAIKTTTKANVLATGAAVASDSSSWAGGTTAFKLVATLSSPQPNRPGLIHVRPKIGKASATFYLDPMIELTPASAAPSATHKSSRYAYEGTETTETGIVRSGGTAHSRKIVTTANSQWLRPYRAEPYAIWNETVGADVTVTVYGNAATLPLTDEIWADVEYLNTTHGTIVTTTKANVLATGVSVASDASSWAGGTTPFKLVATLNSPQPGQPGLINVRVKAAKPSSTFYIDPTPVLNATEPVDYPDAVVSAGAEDAWDLLTGGTGYRGGLTTLTSAPSGWTLTSTAVTTNSASSSPLEGFDVNGRSVVIKHSNATVRDCYIWVPADGTNRDAVVISTSENNLTNILVEYNTIDGKTAETASAPHQNCQAGIKCHATATGLASITIRGNRIMKTRDDGIKIRGANFLVEKNWISVGGMGEPAAHWDGIDVTTADSGGIIQDNMIDATPNANSFGRTSGIAIYNVPDLIVRRNVIHYGADVLDNGWNDTTGLFGPPAPGHYSTYSNYSGNAAIQFTDNVFEYGTAATYTAGSAPYGITAWTGNYRLSTGAVIPLPT